MNLTKISNKIPLAVVFGAVFFCANAASASPVVLPDPVAGSDVVAAAGPKPGIRVITPPKEVSAKAVAHEELSEAKVEPIVKRTWVIRAGQPIHTQIREWATLADWDVRWSLNKSWVAPANIEFSGEFIDALSALINGLYEEGRPVKLLAWTGNRYAEIIGSDAN